MADSDANVSHRSVRLNGTDISSAPLADIVICCTSVPDEIRVSALLQSALSFLSLPTNHCVPTQTELATYAEQMGALHRYDLTLDVTHLIVGAYDTPKYRYVAKERPDVRPMTVEWIEAVRELWIKDLEIDMASLEREHALPVFQSLKFSMTGCDDRKGIPF
jgi:DNA replication regulator DPB11